MNLLLPNKHKTVTNFALKFNKMQHMSNEKNVRLSSHLIHWTSAVFSHMSTHYILTVCYNLGFSSIYTPI